MALNPIVYTEKVVGSFLRYQLTALQLEIGGLDSATGEKTWRTG